MAVASCQLIKTGPPATATECRRWPRNRPMDEGDDRVATLHLGRLRNTQVTSAFLTWMAYVDEQVNMLLAMHEEMRLVCDAVRAHIAEREQAAA